MHVKQVEVRIQLGKFLTNTWVNIIIYFPFDALRSRCVEYYTILPRIITLENAKKPHRPAPLTTSTFDVVGWLKEDCDKDRGACRCQERDGACIYGMGHTQKIQLL